MITKRFILIGDWVISKDGDRHFVSAQHLADLYGLKRSECIMADIEALHTLRGLPKLPRLYPRLDGDYSLPDWVTQ